VIVIFLNFVSIRSYNGDIILVIIQEIPIVVVCTITVRGDIEMHVLYVMLDVVAQKGMIWQTLYQGHTVYIGWESHGGISFISVDFIVEFCILHFYFLC